LSPAGRFHWGQSIIPSCPGILQEKHFARILPAGCWLLGKQARFMFLRAYILLDLTNAMTGFSTARLLVQDAR